MLKARAADQFDGKKGLPRSPLPRRRLCFLRHHHQHSSLLDPSPQLQKTSEGAYLPPLPLQKLQCPIRGCGQTRFFQVQGARNVVTIDDY